jgi:hypothetical protein
VAYRAALWILPLLCHAAGSAETSLTAEEIVRRSVANNNAAWREAPKYAFTETDVISKGGTTTHKQYRVLMIGGSDYEKLLAVNGEPLSAAQAAEEEKKLQREIAHRRNESPEARKKRVSQYEAERRQDHALMTEMVKAFQYKLLGVETMNGRKCYVVEAAPAPGYRPPTHETKVLTGMRGKMWIDAAEFQWVKVHAEVFRSVAFGLFIAHVQPGTEFTLEEAPVYGRVWLPTHFVTDVKASVMHFWSRNSREEETYTDYQPMSEVSAGANAATRNQAPVR